MAWEYVRVKVPADVAMMISDGSVWELMRIFGHGDDDKAKITEASTGSSPYGPYQEGDIWHEDYEDTLLSYDYVIDGDTAHIFRVNKG